MDKVYYVYEWFIVGTGEVFYVGKGKNKRAWQLKENSFFMKMYNSHETDVRIVHKNLNEQKAFELEIELIKYYRENTNYRLTNITKGGNQPPSTLGIKMSKDTKNKIGYANKIAYKNPEIRKKLSESLKKFYNTDKGKKVASARNKKNMENKEIRKKISQSNKKYFSIEENRIKKSIQMKECYNNKSANKARQRKIVQLNTEYKLIKEFESLMQADKETGISFKSISKVLRKNNKTAKGFIFMYLEEYKEYLKSIKSQA